MKVAVIFHRFGPYHVARLEAAAKRCEIAGIELGAHTAEYDWTRVVATPSFERVTLFDESDSRSRPVGELQSRMMAVLAQQEPDVVAIPGWSEKGALVALRWCLNNRLPAILMSESTSKDEQRIWWREFFKRRVLHLCATALVGGQAHKKYLLELGMAGENVFTGYDAVDNDYFAQKSEEVRHGESVHRRIREEYGLPNNYFLASARFLPKKNLSLLIRAYSEYRRKFATANPSTGESDTSHVTGHTSLPWSLVLLGDGPLRADLRSLISDLRLENSVLLPGFKQYDELPVYYGLANAFVHPSKVEQWGLVVNEAMASSLPVIVSNRCGCAPELVKDGINGYSFDPDDMDALVECMLRMTSLSGAERAGFGNKSQEIVDDFAPERFANGLKGAAEAALAAPKRKLRAVDRLILQSLLRR